MSQSGLHPPSTDRDSGTRVLFFSPFAEIIEHSLPERVLQEHMVNRGWDVHVVGCDGFMKAHCAAMSARGIGPTDHRAKKAAVCHSCRQVRRRLRSEGLTSWSAEDFLLPDHSQAASRYLDVVDSENWMEVELDGLPVARFASYEFLLSRKLNENRIPAELMVEYRHYVMNCALSALAAGEAIRKLRPDRVVTYNTLYGVNRVWMAVAEDRGIPCYSIHGGSDPARWHDTLMAYRDDSEQILVAGTPEAVQALEDPISPDEVRAVGQTLEAHLGAATVFIYSRPHEGLPPDAVLSRLGLSSDAPIILLPLASADERHAAAVLGLEAFDRTATVFPDQLEWVRYILTLGERRPDLQFVVRLHPRMFPNRREGQTASAADAYMELLGNAPANVRVNHPADELSLSDILQITSLGACGTSSVGQQMLAYGIPVVVHDPQLLFAYPPSLATVVKDRSEYEGALRQALSDGWSSTRSLHAFRWMNFVTRGLARDIVWRVPQGQSPSPVEGPRRDSAGLPDSVKNRVPFLAKHAVRAMRRSDLMEGIASHAAAPQEPVEDIVSVILDELPGLHVLPLVRGSVSVESELRAHQEAMGRLARVFGAHPDYPNCLGSRMLKYAGPHVS